MSEKIKYDVEFDDFFIERCTGTGKDEKFERLPLSQWKLTKEVTVYANLRRQMETSRFEHPSQIINYSLPITYKILDTGVGKNIYLKLVEKSFDVPRRDNIRSKWITVFLKNVDTGVCQEAPLPNALFSDSDFEFLKITKGTASELDKKQLIELFKSGSCIGTFDFSLQNRLI
jgi:hypothetical protein